MRFEWDRDKSDANQRKHGVGFVDGARLIANQPIELPARSGPNGEQRVKALGQVEGRVIAVIYTRRAGIYRIISARPASRDERREYCELLVARSATGPD